MTQALKALGRACATVCVSWERIAFALNHMPDRPSYSFSAWCYMVWIAKKQVDLKMMEPFLRSENQLPPPVKIGIKGSSSSYP